MISLNMTKKPLISSMKNIYKKKNHIEKLVKDTNRNFKEETQMSNKHTKICNQRTTN